MLGAAAVTMVIGGWFAPASAAATAKDVKVYQLPCSSGPVCQTSDGPVDDGGVVTEKIQIQVQATSNIGLQWVELEVRPDGGDWMCVRHWNTSGASFSSWFNWTTTAYPDTASGCDASPLAGDETPNGPQEIRVSARDQTGTDRSNVAAVVLSNRPSSPSWFTAPRVIGDETNKPRVELRWKPLADDQVVEYHVVRENPDGTENEYAFNANKPGGQGCATDTTYAYTCYDDDFPEDGYGGGYTYTLYAYRSTQATTSDRYVSACDTASGNCIESQSSGSKDASLHNPPRPTPSATERYSPPPPAPSPSGSSSARAGRRQQTQVLGSRSTTDPSIFYQGEYSETLPFQDREGFVPSAPGTSNYAGDEALGGSGYIPGDRDRRPLVAGAGGLLMVLVAGHMARVLRQGAHV